MGTKPSTNFQSDRPESGGADRDMERESSGLLDREKAKFAEQEVEKHSDAPEQASGTHAPFTVGSPRNPDPRKK